MYFNLWNHTQYRAFRKPTQPYLDTLAVASAAVVDVASSMIAADEWNRLDIRIVAEEVYSWNYVRENKSTHSDECEVVGNETIIPKLWYIIHISFS